MANGQRMPPMGMRTCMHAQTDGQVEHMTPHKMRGKRIKVPCRLCKEKQS